MTAYNIIPEYCITIVFVFQALFSFENIRVLVEHFVTVVDVSTCIITVTMMISMLPGKF